LQIYSIRSWINLFYFVKHEQTHNTQHQKLILIAPLVFSIHIWLKLQREKTLFQYDCIPSLRAVKMFSWKRISNSSIIFSIWILVKFWYSIYTRKVNMLLAKQNIQCWDEWLVIYVHELIVLGMGAQTHPHLSKIIVIKHHINWS
jgi:hypothetical protein